MPILLRPLTLGELLDRSFQLYRSRFAIFAGIAAVAYLPVFVLQALTLWSPKVISPTMGIAAATGFLVLVVLRLLGVAAANSATIIVVSAAYLERPITVGEAYRRVWGMLLRVFFIMIATGIGIGIGFVFLIVPGVILFLMWALAIPVAVLEDAGLGESISRSRELTAGHRGRVFAIYMLYFALLFGLESMMAAPLGILVVLKGAHSPATMATIVGLLDVIIGYVVTSLVTPVISISLSLMYYDERVRKEAFDIHAMMNALGEAPPQSATATA
ncbi:MAG TPA: glycerophosphoryl diester phosphodiesterase membrane domain-containing protein [Terriglobales bacterium]|nr:glycerophosphoryl diester phosphodiesterase membrane domain-containing protein [Terriglobales bacterium]